MTNAHGFIAGALASTFALSACSPDQELGRTQLHEGERPIVQTTEPSENITPNSSVLECYGGLLAQSGGPVPVLSVGNIRDYTGKNSDGEGFAITQGGSLMAYSALGKMLPGIKLSERFDTQIADAELSYIANRQLGDGTKHAMSNPDTGEVEEVAWKPYYGGSVLETDYYIVGGITELNYNIQTGGAEFSIDQLGGKRRTYTMNVAVDLRIVGTQSLRVYDTVSLQKQITGYEVGMSIFRFFDSRLYDVNAGVKEQEPLQLAVRSTIEGALLELVKSVTHVPFQKCLDDGEAK